MKRACVQTLCPSDLSTHLDMNITRLDSYDLLKREIERYCEQVATRSGSAPMDISALHRPKGGKEKKYPRGGKPKGSQGTVSGPGAGARMPDFSDERLLRGARDHHDGHGGPSGASLADKALRHETRAARGASTILWALGDGWHHCCVAWAGTGTSGVRQYVGHAQGTVLLQP